MVLHDGDLLYELTLIASSPLSNRLKMLLSAFYLHGLFGPRAFLECKYIGVNPLDLDLRFVCFSLFGTKLSGEEQKICSRER